MNAIRSLAFAAAVTLSAAVPASAMTVADFAVAKAPLAAPAAFLFSEPLVPGEPTRLDRVDVETARSAVESYFDYDALITLGALALAGAGLTAFGAYAGRRKIQEDAESADPAWRQSVFRAIQADLAEFTESFRRAA
jgi:hypothetical protein